MTGRGAVAVVAEAGDLLEATIWVDALHAAGINARSYERGVGAALGGAVTTGVAGFPVVVSREDLGQARSVIADMGGTASFAPIEAPGERGRAQQRGLTLVGLIVGGALLIALVAKLIAG
ncbi:MAG: hypothetical protein ABI782_05735 [Anaerolineaceae bacterium]